MYIWVIFVHIHIGTYHICVHFVHIQDIYDVYLEVGILCLRVCKLLVLQDNVRLIFKIVLPIYTCNV